MSYAFQSPRAQVSSTLPRANDDYTHDPYSADPQHQYAPYYSQQDHDHYRDDLGDSHDSNPARTLHRDHQQSYDDDHHYSDTRAGASAIDDHNMSAEKGNYGSPYAAKRASGNSIWTKDDKRAFSSRSCPAKFFRILIGNLILAIIFIVSIILLIVMFLRPPNVAISGVSVPNQNAVSYQNGAFSFNVSVDISVSNPNSISANIKKLNATAYDSADQSTALGHGLVTNQAIRANANTTVVFPFQIRYSQSEDPDFSIIQNIASDCGLTGGSGGGDLSFLFKVEVDVEVLSITVPVNINRNISFPCPLSASSLQGVLSGLGGSLGNILGGGGSAGRRAITEGAEADYGALADLVRRQLAKRAAIDMSSVELVAAVADGLARRYAPTPKDEGKRSLADEHDAL
ncbi:expressed protein [Pseudozyma hubeiensis SY62]|uniref:Expressed protein n=1 Tax=Pseudozyma hubeiensis (strain SY62) TaxID=1305764 RepID=R9PH50_PSEHS|nr:expressed protein [Pseudozyma hubeiensis SY62]GAC97410.1 expressed protein [Pseudozyma hubeiensis SY62]